MARCLCVHQTAVPQQQAKLAAQVGTQPAAALTCQKYTNKNSQAGPLFREAIKKNSESWTAEATGRHCPIFHLLGAVGKNARQPAGLPLWLLENLPPPP